MPEDWSKYLFGHGRISRYVPFILCAVLILFMSTSNASMANTSRFVRPFLEFLFPEAAESTLQMYHFYIRKFAHLFEYAVLAIVSSRAFKSSSKRYLNGIWPIAALIAVLTIASIDEINQSLGTTRTGSIYDIFLDFVGGCIGVSTYFLTFKLWIGVMNPGGSENRLPES